jgi:hypothetical protein
MPYFPRRPIWVRCCVRSCDCGTTDDDRRVAGAPLRSHFGRDSVHRYSVSAAIRDYLQASSAALEAAGSAAARSCDAALAGYATEMAVLCREGLTRILPADEVERVFVLGFALEQLHLHFEDLDRSVRECVAPRV